MAVVALSERHAYVRWPAVLRWNAMAGAAGRLRDTGVPHGIANQPWRRIHLAARSATVAIHRSAARGCRVVGWLSSVRSGQGANPRDTGEHEGRRPVIDVSGRMQARRDRVAFSTGDGSTQEVAGLEMRPVGADRLEAFVDAAEHVLGRRGAGGVPVTIGAAAWPRSEIYDPIRVLRGHKLARRVARLMARRTSVVRVTGRR